MKTVLAFGDSNTWGLVPGLKPHVRYADDVRWTGVLQNKLANDCKSVYQSSPTELCFWQPPIM